jgi:drug/metabolite transporter (DMT)-like permease
MAPAADHEHEHDPVAVGGLFAVAAAVAFGATTPLIKRFGTDAGPFWTAGLLYAGATLASSVAPSRGEAALRRAHAVRLLVVTLLGAVAAPVCLAWGLHRTSATGASLLLNFEAPFTVLLAHLLFAEPVGKRVGLALLFMAGGAALLASGQDAAAGGRFVGWGALAVLAASLAWAADSTLTRPLADVDPSRVVAVKSAIGAALTAAVAWSTGESFPSRAHALALTACGAVGYGLSLRFYLLAQRRIGAARTGSIFAVGPFVGAIVAWTMGGRTEGGSTLAAGLLFGVAIYLHLTERHGHGHVHDALEHDHAHRHDDGHHTHAHASTDSPGEEHSHRHRHEEMAHTHAHGADVHHRHRH